VRVVADLSKRSCTPERSQSISPFVHHRAGSLPLGSLREGEARVFHT